MFKMILSKRIAFVALCITVICTAFIGVLSGRDLVSASAPQTIPATGAKSAQDVGLQFMSAARDGEKIKAIFCYTLPTSEDWQLSGGAEDASLTIDNQVFYLWGAGLVDPEKATNQMGLRRCGFLLFEVPAGISGEATLTLKHLVTSLPDWYDCAVAQAKLNQSLHGKGIFISCYNQDHQCGFTIQAKPESLSLDDAYKIVEEEGFSSSVDGPWEFSTRIK